jgi:hypothetical protein
MNDHHVMYLPTQTDKGFLEDALRRAMPWTVADYERVRRAAIALVRTHTTWDHPAGPRPSFDGAAYWKLLGALDRADNRDPGYGE